MTYGVGKQHALFRQPVDVGRVDLLEAVGTERPLPVIVRHHDNNIQVSCGLGSADLGCGQREDQQEGKKKALRSGSAF